MERAGKIVFWGTYKYINLGLQGSDISDQSDIVCQNLRVWGHCSRINDIMTLFIV